MKKLLLILALGLSALTAHAQLYLGGSLSLLGESGGVTVGLNPEVGYAFSDRIAVGSSVSVMLIEDNAWLSVDPYFRFYYWELGPVRLYADAHLTYHYKGFGAGVRPGFAVPLSDHFFITTQLGQIGWYDRRFNADVNLALRYTSFSPIVGIYYRY
jgi:hypothetical protein